MTILRLGESLCLGIEPRIAVPINDEDIVLCDSLQGADMAELRIDLFTPPVSAQRVRVLCQEAARKFCVPLIATFRSTAEGGALNVDDRVRLEVIKEILDVVDAIDVEIGASIAPQVVDLAARAGIMVIGSFHDFLSTPSREELEGVFLKGRELGMSIVKIAATPHTVKDMQVLTAFTLTHADDAVVVLGMGSLGMSSRVHLPRIGSLFTFASLTRNTAPGQLSLDEMQKFFSSFTKR